MNETVVAQVEELLDAALVFEDDALLHARSTDNGLPPIGVAPSQGALLAILAASIRARRILEIGTLAGYSSIWLARSLPADGRLVTLELDPRHAEVARENLRRAGMAERAEVIVGPALESLARLEGPFDLVCVDADKRSIPEYWSHSRRMVRPGGIIVVDNVVRDGRVLEPGDDPDVLGIRRLLEGLKGDDSIQATALQTVGAKGHDGFLIARVVE